MSLVSVLHMEYASAMKVLMSLFPSASCLFLERSHSFFFELSHFFLLITSNPDRNLCFCRVYLRVGSNEMVVKESHGKKKEKELIRR